MPNPFKISSTRHYAAKGILLASALVLGGCVMDDPVLEDTYVANDYQERYPIKVAEAPVKMNISAKAGALRGDQVNSVIGFAQDARSTASSGISVRYSSGSAKARQVAHESVAILVDQGIPRSMIHTGSYRGSAAMVTLSFNRKVAVTKECGDWSENLAGDQYNEPYPNHGCALQQNIAAMVANPEDFETPRAMSPVMGVTRSEAIKKYNTGLADGNSSSSSSDSSSDASSSSN